MRAVARFPEDVAIDHDDRVGRDHHCVASALRDRVRLAARKPLGVPDRSLAREQRLIDVGRTHLMRDADQRQEFTATGRRRGEDDGDAHGEER
jgi:hypothetical protein